MRKWRYAHVASQNVTPFPVISNEYEAGAASKSGTSAEIKQQATRLCALSENFLAVLASTTTFDAIERVVDSAK